MAEFLSWLMVGGGGAGVASIIWKVFGDRWMANQFGKQLEKFKAEQDALLKRLQYEIDRKMDRAERQHAMEYAFIPDAWSRLVNAYATVDAFLSPLRLVPDVTVMPVPEFLAYCATNGVADEVAGKLSKLEGHMRASATTRCIRRSEWAVAFKMVKSDISNIQVGGIWIPADIESAMTEIYTHLKEALLDWWGADEEQGSGGQRATHPRFPERATELLNELRVRIRTAVRDEDGVALPTVPGSTNARVEG